MFNSPQLDRRWVAAATLCVCMIAGCEERVVGVKNRWSGGQPQFVAAQPVREPQRKGILEGIGDAMFGWTRHLFPEEKKTGPTVTTKRPEFGAPVTRTSQMPPPR